MLSRVVPRVAAWVLPAARHATAAASLSTQATGRTAPAIDPLDARVADAMGSAAAAFQSLHRTGAEGPPMRADEPGQHAEPSMHAHVWPTDATPGADGAGSASGADSGSGGGDTDEQAEAARRAAERTVFDHGGHARAVAAATARRGLHTSAPAAMRWSAGGDVAGAGAGTISNSEPLQHVSGSRSGGGGYGSGRYPQVDHDVGERSGMPTRDDVQKDLYPEQQRRKGAETPDLPGPPGEPDEGPSEGASAGSTGVSSGASDRVSWPGDAGAPATGTASDRHASDGDRDRDTVLARLQRNQPSAINPVEAEEDDGQGGHGPDVDPKTGARRYAMVAPHFQSRVRSKGGSHPESHLSEQQQPFGVE